MYINPGYTAGIIALSPSGTNSTMFTECCAVAICDDEAKCPSCGRNVIGWDSPQDERRKIRWRNATQHWKR